MFPSMRQLWRLLRNCVPPPIAISSSHAESPRGWFLGAVERAALKDYTWHCNRHTFAGRLVMTGVDVQTVEELLGHRTAQIPSSTHISA